MILIFRWDMVSYSLTRKACYVSYIVQAITINLAPLFFVIFSEKFSLSTTELGLLILFNFSVQLCVDILSIKVISTFGYKISATVSNVFATLGIAGLSVLPNIMPPVLGLLISVFLYSVGAGLIEVVINPIIEALPSDNIGASMSLLHSFYSWGQTSVILLTSFALLMVGDDLWYLLPIFWALVPLVNTFLFIKAPMIEITGISEAHSIVKMLKSRVFIVFFILMICAGSTEMVISQWASYFAEKGLGVTKLVGDLIGPCIFALMMATGRTLYGRFGAKISMLKALIVCSSTGVLAYIGISFIKNPVITMICFALVGLASSLMWPGTLSLASERIPTGGTPMFAILALAGDVGCSIGPWFNGLINDTAAKSGVPFMESVGFTRDAAALRFAILALGVFPLLMLIVLLTLKVGKRIRK